MTFTSDTFAFLSDLTANNAKSWFDAHRERYQSAWLDPARAFVADWAAFMAGLRPPHRAEPRVNGSIRRINRDVRFAKDKAPYDPKIHLVFWCGDHPNRSPAIHVVVRSDQLNLGTGQWAMTPQDLARYRARVEDDDDGGRLAALIGGLETDGFSLAGAALKRLPKGTRQDTGRDQLLKRKGLVLTTGKAPLSLCALEDREMLKDRFARMAAVNAWLVQADIA